jgi:uncharacterized protein (TIGR00369 family)
MTTPIRVPDPAYAARVRACFEAQALMSTLSARLSRLEPGEVDIAFAFDQAFTQQNGFVHAGIVTALVDTACGLAAYTLMPADADVLSVEFKINLLRPAVGERFLACGRVIKPGSTLVVTQGELRAWPQAEADGEGQQVAIMQATMIRR